jgi:glutathione S-transferase
MSNDGNSGSGAALKLYDRMRSGNCYRARLMLALLALEYQRIAVNTAGGASIFLGTHQPVRGDHPSQAHDDPARSGENSSAWFLARNPRGQVPVLETDGKAIWDSIAIIVYLARRFGGEQWLPLEPHAMAGVTQWLILSQNELLYGLAQCRGVLNMGRAGDLEKLHALAHAGLRPMEQRLAGHDWLAAERVTIADVACYPYVSLSEECGIELEAYPAISGWLERFAALPGYVAIYQ